MDRLATDRPRVIAIAGPTAVGKSDLAVELALQIGAEIVVADSRQVYVGLDIGTAKPSADDQRRVRHHLVDSLGLHETSTAGQWYRRFAGVLEDATARAVPLVVTGGSTLYLDALVNGPSALPPVSRATRDQVEDEYDRPRGPDALYRELKERDPEVAASLDPSKRRRLVRYVGVLRETGQRPSASHAEDDRADVEVGLAVLYRPRPELYARIDRRVDRMMAAGLLDEVSGLAAGDRPSVLSATIGYQELLPVLDGERTLEDGVRLVKRNSRRYAKRQYTWLRRYPSAFWMDSRVATPDLVLEAASRDATAA